MIIAKLRALHLQWFAMQLQWILQAHKADRCGLGGVWQGQWSTHPNSSEFILLIMHTVHTSYTEACGVASDFGALELICKSDILSRQPISHRHVHDRCDAFVSQCPDVLRFWLDAVAWKVRLQDIKDACRMQSPCATPLAALHLSTTVSNMWKQLG